MEGHAFVESAHFGSPSSHLCVGSAFAIIIVSLLLTLIRRSRALRRAAMADARVDPTAPLAPGRALVAGTVELARGAPLAVRVRIEQRGTEHKGKSSWSHTWSEVDRRTEAHPFYLRREEGERVRVEPGTRVLLVDDVDEVELLARDRRVRIAELTEGENAIVEGVLERGADPERRGAGDAYRDAASPGWILRPLSTEPLHISSEPLGDRHRHRAGELLKAAVLIAVLGLGTVPAAPTYLARQLYGETVEASVVERRHYTTRERDRRGMMRTVTHYVAALEAESGQRDELGLDYRDWTRLREHQRLTYRRVADWLDASALGPGGSIHWIQAAILAALALVAFAAAEVSHRARRWYEGKLVETGQGRLPDVVVGQRPKKTRRAKRRRA